MFEIIFARKKQNIWGIADLLPTRLLGLCAHQWWP